MLILENTGDQSYGLGKIWGETKVSEVDSEGDWVKGQEEVNCDGVESASYDNPEGIALVKISQTSLFLVKECLGLGHFIHFSGMKRPIGHLG